jgi:DNA-binding beta-propeller fold protein YncE
MLVQLRKLAFACVLGSFAVAPISAHEGHDHKNAPGDAASITGKVKTGAGANTYESLPNWCKLPEGKNTLGPTHGGIVVDKQGLIYFSMDSGPNGIMVYTPEGKLVKSIANEFAGIHGMTLREENGEEFIYAAHLKGKQVVKLKLDGAAVLKFGVPMESGKYKNPGQYNPTAVAVGPNGNIYVADGYGTGWLHSFDNAGKYIKSFGGPGTEPGQFKTPHGMGLDTRGEKPLLLVCDRENRRLQHFDLDGNFVKVVTTNLRRPCSVSFHGDRVAIAELEARVTILNGKNEQVAHLGDNPEKKHWANFGVPVAEWKEGFFTAPHGVSFDKAGNVYVMDWNASGRVSKLNWIKPDQAASAAKR